MLLGPRDELLKEGVVTKEGSKFLIFGGTRLEPARNLNPAVFTAIDKTQTLSIALPRIDKKYKIVSRQSPEFLSGDVTNEGRGTRVWSRSWRPRSSGHRRSI